MKNNLVFMSRGLIIFILLIFTALSCQKNKDKRDSFSTIPLSMDSLIEMNKKMLKKEIQEIEDYVNSNKLDMEKSGSGMFMKMVNDVEGNNASAGERVVFSFRIKSLKGELIYASEESGLRNFVVDQSRVESGLNEAAKRMSLSDSAIIILPPHLAFGRVGDGNKIGRQTTLMYELRLDSIISKPQLNNPGA